MAEEQGVQEETMKPGETAPEQTEAVAAETVRSAQEKGASLDRVLGVDLELRAELARVNLPIRDILELAPGSVISLKKAVGESIDVFVNDKLLARGEAVVVDDQLGIRITEISGEAAVGSSVL